MDSELLRQALTECRGRRRQNAERERRRFAQAAEACPEIARLDARRREALHAGLRAALAGEDTGREAALVEQSTRDIARLLVEKGFGRDFLNPLYSCARCRDTGYSDEGGRRLCTCVLDRYNALQNQGVLSEAAESFERFKDTVFPETLVPERGVSQRAYMRAMRDRCQAYADSLPDAPVNNLLFYGHSGLGKTYLLRCIGVRAMQRRIPTLALSANALLNRIRKDYFAREQEENSYLTRVPLLLVDDLGTEPLWENITVEQLHVLFSERLDRGLHTVICTNLTLSELKERYTERLMSRLMDERRCSILPFFGQDIRGLKG